MRIARHPASDTTEGWVEQISCSRLGAAVRLALPDGTAAETCVSGDEMEWLELRVGQIVALQPEL
jgi:hypothetical protein